MGFQQEDYRNKVPFSSHHVKSHDMVCDQRHDLRLLMSQITWLKQLVRILQCKVSPTLYSLEFSLEESHHAQHIGNNLFGVPLHGRYPCVPPFINLFNQLFTLGKVSGCLFYTLDFNLIVLSLFCSICSRLGHWKVFHLFLCPFDILLSLSVCIYKSISLTFGTVRYSSFILSIP